jgi:hypothetical protein
MAKGNVSGILETLAVGAIVVFVVLLIPRVITSIAEGNARIARQNSPGAAGDSVIARLINSGGDVGVGLIDKWGGSLLNLGGE